jgi:hypothetical protein
MSNIPFDRREMHFGNAMAIQDPATVSHLEAYAPNFYNVQSNKRLSEEFCEEYRQWITTSQVNKFSGLEKFQYAAFSNGTTEGFDKFYFKNHTRRFRCFRGEYKYHELAWRNSWPNWKYIEDCDLDKNDAVVISSPFSDTGDIHPLQHQILETCNKLKIPVLIDCAFFGLCRDIEFEFNYDCITDLTFSLSKPFPVAHVRIGMRLTRIDDDDPLFVLNKTQYTNRISADLGLHFIQKFGPDYITNTYKDTQAKFCQQLNVAQSKSVLFGIASDTFNEYNRGRSTNRLSFHKFLANHTLGDICPITA